MKKNKYSISFLLCGIISASMLVGCALPQHVYAATMAVSPRVIDLNVSPRDVKEEKIHIENHSGGALTLFTSVNNVSMGPSGGIEPFVSPSMSNRSTSLASWLEIKRASIDVPPGGSVDLPLTIRVDPNAKPGTYHVLLSFSSGRTVDEAEAVVANNEAPSVLLTVRLLEPSNDFMKLSRFSIKQLITNIQTPDTVTYNVVNTGDTELKPYGDILIYNGKGEEVGAIPVNPESRSIRPGDSSIFKTQIPSGNFFGKYKALLTMRYGKGDAALYDTEYFYVLPLKKILIYFFSFLAFTLILVLFVHHYATSGRGDPEDDIDDDVFHLPVFLTNTSSQPHERDVVMKNT